MTAVFPDGLASDAGWFLHQIDPVRRQALFVRIERGELAQAAFLDERLLQGTRDGGWLPLSALPSMAGVEPASRYIFHIGHCGSTLISRLLEQWPGTLVLREPLALRTLAELEENAASALARFSPQSLPTLRQTVLRLLGRPFSPGQHTLIKATSSCNVLIEPLLAERSDARIVLLTIPLSSYLATVLKSSSARLDALSFAPRRLAWLHAHLGEEQPRLHAMTDAETIATGWLAELARFAALGPSEQLLRVDFDKFLRDPEALLQQVAGFMGLANDIVSVQSALSSPIAGQYAKDRTHAYSAGDREHDLALSRQRFGDEISQGILHAEKMLAQHPQLTQLTSQLG